MNSLPPEILEKILLELPLTQVYDLTLNLGRVNSQWRSLHLSRSFWRELLKKNIKRFPNHLTAYLKVSVNYFSYDLIRFLYHLENFLLKETYFSIKLSKVGYCRSRLNDYLRQLYIDCITGRGIKYFDVDILKVNSGRYVITGMIDFTSDKWRNLIITLDLPNFVYFLITILISTPSLPNFRENKGDYQVVTKALMRIRRHLRR